MGHDGNSTDDRPFPMPFGGVPSIYDFPITLLFGLGFAVAFGIDLYTICRKRTRTFTKATTLCLAFERMLGTSLRMAQALLDDFRESWGITEYLQAAFSAGFMTLMQEQLYLILCAASSATRDGLPYEEWQRAVEKNPGVKEARQKERDNFRKWTRKMDVCIMIVQSIQITIAVQAEMTGYNRGATWMLYCRFFGNLMALFVSTALLSMIHDLKDMEGINKQALQRIKTTLIIILFIPLSRCLLSFETATTLSASPADLKPATIVFKAIFYLLQFTPELAACLITASTDYKALCDTGVWGDWPRWRVEQGQPAKPKSIATIQCLFMPWKWPRLLSSQMRDRRRRRSQKARLHEYGLKSGSLSYDEGGEKLLHNPSSSFGWQSSVNLSTLGGNHRLETAPADLETQSIQTEVSFPSSAANSWSSKASSTGSAGSNSSLITNVSLWKPRIPDAFTFDADSRYS